MFSGTDTRVLVEPAAVVDPWLGESAGGLDAVEMPSTSSERRCRTIGDDFAKEAVKPVAARHDGHHGLSDRASSDTSA